MVEISEDLALLLGALIGSEFLSASSKAQDIEVAASQEDEQSISGRTDIGPTTRTQLIQARRGQGVFRTNVLQNEKTCRVTGTTELPHLRASHIKPWKLSTDTEKLDGCNGLMLAPHVDHLFDKGWITFADSGKILVSPQLRNTLLPSWGVQAGKGVGKFSQAQCTYLEFHRNEIFRK